MSERAGKDLDRQKERKRDIATMKEREIEELDKHKKVREEEEIVRQETNKKLD